MVWVGNSSWPPLEGLQLSSLSSWVVENRQLLGDSWEIFEESLCHVKKVDQQNGLTAEEKNIPLKFNIEPENGPLGKKDPV